MSEVRRYIIGLKADEDGHTDFERIMEDLPGVKIQGINRNVWLSEPDSQQQGMADK